PDRAAVALFQRQAIPTLAARFSGSRDDVEAPGLFASVRIESDNVVPPGRSAADSLHYLAFGHQRPASDPYPLLVIADLAIPGNLPSLYLQRRHVGVRGRYEKAVAIDRKISLN